MTVDFTGQTTLVTGASAGIGREFARQLAARGSHLVLVARCEDQLLELAAELEPAHGVKVTSLAFDLSEPRAGERLREQITARGLHLTSLINNAGFGTYEPFHQENPARLREELAVNVTAVVDISRLVPRRRFVQFDGSGDRSAPRAALTPSLNRDEQIRHALLGRQPVGTLTAPQVLVVEHRRESLGDLGAYASQHLGASLTTLARNVPGGCQPIVAALAAVARSPVSGAVAAEASQGLAGDTPEPLGLHGRAADDGHAWRVSSIRAPTRQECS